MFSAFSFRFAFLGLVLVLSLLGQFAWADVPPKTTEEDLKGWSSVKPFSFLLSKDVTPVELHFGKSKYLIPRNYLAQLLINPNGYMFVQLNFFYPAMAGSEEDDERLLAPYNPNIVQVFMGVNVDSSESHRVAIAPVERGDFTPGPYGLVSSPDHSRVLHSNLYVDLRKPEAASIVMTCPDDLPYDLFCTSWFEAPGGLNTKISFDKSLLPHWKRIIDTIHTDLSKFYAGEML
jgi:hypothetical protein